MGYGPKVAVYQTDVKVMNTGLNRDNDGVES